MGSFRESGEGHYYSIDLEAGDNLRLYLNGNQGGAYALYIGHGQLATRADYHGRADENGCLGRYALSTVAGFPTGRTATATGSPPVTATENSPGSPLRPGAFWRSAMMVKGG